MVSRFLEKSLIPSGISRRQHGTFPISFPIGPISTEIFHYSLCRIKVKYLTCGNKMPTRCNRGFYCISYCLINMFRASLCPSSGAQEYYTLVAACGISCCKNVKNNFVSFCGICGTQIPQKLTKLFFTFLQHEIPQAATNV